MYNFCLFNLQKRSYYFNIILVYMYSNRIKYYSRSREKELVFTRRVPEYSCLRSDKREAGGNKKLTYFLQEFTPLRTVVKLFCNIKNFLFPLVPQRILIFSHYSLIHALGSGSHRALAFGHQYGLQHRWRGRRNPGHHAGRGLDADTRWRRRRRCHATLGRDVVAGVRGQTAGTCPDDAHAPAYACHASSRVQNRGRQTRHGYRGRCVSRPVLTGKCAHSALAYLAGHCVLVRL